MSIQIISAPLVNVRVTSNINAFASERRFDKSLTIADLKGRLELVTGGAASSMTLTVFDDTDQLVCSLGDDAAMLGSFPINDNFRIHVVDGSKRVGEFEDLSSVPKFELTDDEYSKKTDSVRAFLMKNRLGKFNAEEQALQEAQKEEADRQEEEKAAALAVDDRCEVRVQAEPTRRGTVMFVGKTHFKPGWWVGVRFDEPHGKNDGSVGGKRYFECPPKYGGFVRPLNLEVGDFPELDYDLDEM